MALPNAHYTLSLINHETAERLKVELFNLPFPGARSYDSHLPNAHLSGFPSMQDASAVASATQKARQHRRTEIRTSSPISDR
jgi:hypothetical protein